MFLVRHGRLTRQRRTPAADAALAVELRTLVGEAAALGRPPARVGKAEVDQINIIARWIHHHSEDDERAFFRLPSDLADAGECERFVERVVLALHAPPASDALTEEESEDDAVLTPQTGPRADE